MVENQQTLPQDPLLDHEYDGIREFDNPCPSWWSWLFFLSAVFAAVYFFYFHIGRAGLTVKKAHENAVADNLRLRFAEIGELQPDAATLSEYMQKPEWLKVGESVYEQRCKSCHGDGGRGLVGPNLTDDYYKNVRQLTDLASVIADGAANGSMPAWRTRLHPNEIVLSAAYVGSLRGQNLSGPRGPEGNQIPPWPSAGSGELTGEESSEQETPTGDSAAAPATDEPAAEKPDDAAPPKSTP